MKFGCCINKTEDVARVKQAGYDYFEFSGAAAAAMSEEEFVALCAESEKYSLPCIGFNAYCAGTPAIVGARVDNELTASYAELACRRADQIGAKNIGIGAPKARMLPEEYPADKADAECAEFLRISCSAAEKYGEKLLLEAVCSRLCDYMTHTEEAVNMVKCLEIKNLAIVLDFYNMELMGEKPALAEITKPYLAHTHISTSDEGTGRGFPQEDEREKYAEIFSVLKSVGYDGSMSVEPSAFDFEQAVSCLEMLKKTYTNIYNA